MSLDKLMSLIRAGLLEVWLDEEKIHWRARQKNKGFLPSLRQYGGTLHTMLASSDTRLCVDVPAHCELYQHKAAWYTCPACAMKRAALAQEKNPLPTC